MKKVRFITGKNHVDVQNKLNEYLDGIEATDLKLIYEYLLSNNMVIVEYDTNKRFINTCSECHFYDPSGGSTKVWGACRRARDKQVKFSAEACKLFISRWGG